MKVIRISMTKADLFLRIVEAIPGTLNKRIIKEAIYIQWGKPTLKLYHVNLKPFSVVFYIAISSFVLTVN